MDRRCGVQHRHLKGKRRKRQTVTGTEPAPELKPGLEDKPFDKVLLSAGASIPHLHVAGNGH